MYTHPEKTDVENFHRKKKKDIFPLTMTKPNIINCNTGLFKTEMFLHTHKHTITLQFEAQNIAYYN